MPVGGSGELRPLALVAAVRENYIMITAYVTTGNVLR